MAVTIGTAATVRAGASAVVFEEGPYARGGGVQYDINPDGQRFLMIKLGDPSDAATQISVVLVKNWVEELKERVPVP